MPRELEPSSHPAERRPCGCQGADANARNDRGTPLHAAAYERHAAIVMLLLERGADPTSRDGDGRTPADYASLCEAVWPLFEARGCRRLTQSELVERGVLKGAVGDGGVEGRGHEAAGTAAPRSGHGRFTVRPPWRPVTRAGTAAASGGRATADVLGRTA